MIYGKDTTLKLWYPMTIGSGTTLKDYSDNANDGNITGADWVKHTNLGDYTLKLNGTTGRVTFSSIETWSTALDLTICIWFKTLAGTDQHIIYNYGDYVSGGTTFRFQMQSTGELGIYTDSAARFDATNSLKTVSQWNDDEWHFVCFVQDGVTNDEIFIYVDGEVEASASITTEGSANGTYPTIGTERYNGGFRKFFNGSLCDFRYFKRALSQAEIKTIYKKTYRR